MTTPPSGPAPAPARAPGTSRRAERLASLTLAVGALAGATSLVPVVPLVLAAAAVGLAVLVRRRHDVAQPRRTARTGAWVGAAGALVNVLLVVLPRLSAS